MVIYIHVCVYLKESRGGVRKERYGESNIQYGYSDFCPSIVSRQDFLDLLESGYISGKYVYLIGAAYYENHVQNIAKNE